MNHHNECAANEIWVGNTHRGAERLDFFKSKGLTSVRLGKVAYDIDGKVLPGTYSPIIIQRAQADLHNDIMMTAAFGPNWRRNG
ncbi:MULTISPECIES: hypothetical protein [unclassified Sinorhizobium]|uniref:hypothetical protein n=1 Tax=unclassified Sinorhizobium TaxID=2613772 RepID=UPI0035232ABC